MSLFIFKVYAVSSHSAGFVFAIGIELEGKQHPIPKVVNLLKE